MIAGSVGGSERAKKIVNKLGITYSIGFGMNAEEISRITGAFYDREGRFLHATGFLVRPDKAIVDACYSSGPIGRLVAKDT